MELRQMEYVVTLAEELSFRRAAERLTIAQSGLSQQVRRLERELGVALFDRSTHHVALTTAGSAFVREARRTLESAARARRAAVDRAVDTDRLVVCVGSSDMDTMPTVLRALGERRPGLDVTTTEGGLPRQRQLFGRGELDVGLALLDGDPGPGLAARLLRREPMGVVVTDRHRLASTPQVRWADLADQTLLVASPAEHPEYNDFLHDVLDDAGITPELVECTEVSAAVAAVCSDRGVLCLPELPVLPAGLVWRALAEPAVGLPTSLVWRRHDDRAVLRELLDVAGRTARELHWLG